MVSYTVARMPHANMKMLSYLSEVSGSVGKHVPAGAHKQSRVQVLWKGTPLVSYTVKYSHAVRKYENAKLFT